MSKIFGIGLSKTGTTSLCLALRELGYSVFDYPRTVEQIDSHDAATDASVAVQFRELDELYPGSKFIYTTRHLDPWLVSCERFWAKMYQDNDPHHVDVFTRLYGSYSFDRDLFATAYARHESRVADHFAGRDDLLQLAICDGDGWERLCDFLGRQVSGVRFPHSNSLNQAVDYRRRRSIWEKIRPYRRVVPKPVKRWLKRGYFD